MKNDTHLFTKKIPIDRKKEIQQYVLRKGSCSIKELSNLFHVSSITIRRDIAELEKNGKIKSARGGVIPIITAKEVMFDKKQLLNLHAKASIAQALTTRIESGASVFMNGGSTTKECAKILLGEKHSLRIITNNYEIPSLITPDTDNKAVLLGGEYHANSHSFLYTPAIPYIDFMYAQYCVLGTNGISITDGLTTSVLDGAATDRKFITQTKGSVIVVADSSKIEVVSSFKVCDLSTINILITDKHAPKQFIDAVKKNGIQVILA